MSTTTDQLGYLATASRWLRDLTTTHNPAAGSGAGGGDRLPAPLNLSVFGLADEIHAILGSWVRVIIEECPGDPWPADTTPAICSWLIAHDYLIDYSPAPADYRREVADLHHRVRHLVGDQPVVIRCTNEVEGQRCGGRVEGMDADGDPTDEVEAWRWCLCRACGVTYTFDAGLKRLGQLQQLTLPQYAEEAGIDYKRLQRKVAELGTQHDGQAGRHRLFNRERLVAVNVAIQEELAERKKAG